MAREDCRRPAMLEEEAHCQRVCHTPSHVAHAQLTCEIGQNHNVEACGSHAGFPTTELGGDGRQQQALLLR